MNMILSLLLLASSVAISQAAYSCNTYCGYSAVKNASVAPAGSVNRTSYFFDEGKFPPSVYDAQDGVCGLQVYVNDNTITITGVVYAYNDPSTGFFMNIQGTRNTNGETGYLELTSSSYVANGGTINPATWYFYFLSSGALTGFGAYEGTLLPLMESMHPLQVGYGANGKNFNFGLSAWFSYNINGQMYMSDINLDLSCKAVVCTPNFNVTSVNVAGAAPYALTFSSTTGTEIKWNFVDPTGIFVEDATLTSAVLGGQIRQIDGTGPVCTFALLLVRDLTYNTPHEEFPASAYAANGGPIDPSAWRYYSLVSSSVTCPTSYTAFTTYEGMDFQVGLGANGKDYNFGASGWFDYTNSTSGDNGRMDVNIDLVCGPLAPTPAPPTPAPTPVPTAVPTTVPTVTPTTVPTTVPTVVPTTVPTTVPTVVPTTVPTVVPTVAPTTVPTIVPTVPVTPAPTPAPSDTGASSSGASTTSASSSGASTSASSTTGSYTCPPNPYIAEQAIADQYGGYSYFAVIFNDTNIDAQWRFNFLNNVGTFIINEDDGTAALYGTLVPESSNPDDGLFDFNIDFYVGFNAGSTTAEPHKELNPDAYVPLGPVDPTTWRYFTYANSTTTPQGANAYSLNVVPFMNMEFQVGAGANGKNVNFGGSAWFSFYLVNSANTLVSSGVADVNIDLVCQPGASSGSSATDGNGSDSQGVSTGSATTSLGQATPPASSPSPARTAGAATTTTVSMALVFLVALVLNL